MMTIGQPNDWLIRKKGDLVASVIVSDGAPSPSKPRCLGLLNEIAEAERRGFAYLTTWADACRDPEVETTLRLVAAREAEHSASFARRVVELGFRVRPRDDNDEEVSRLEVACSDLDDKAKFEALGYGSAPTEDLHDVFERYFEDHTIDPATGALLGRFIAEERDSGRLLAQAYQGLLARTCRPVD